MFLKSNADTPTRFSNIYSQNLWKNGESLSGFGSTLAASRTKLAKALSRWLKNIFVKTILDVPSGDYNWMRFLKFSGRYIGGDIVEELARENQTKYGDDRHRFMRLDVIKDSLPQADLVLCRECLNHLSLNEVKC